MNWILALLKITLFTTTGVGAVRLIEEAVISEFIEVRGQHFLFEMGVSDTAKSAAHRFCDDHILEEQSGNSNDFDTCVTFVISRAAELLEEHGLEDSAGKGTGNGFGTRPRLQWLRQNCGCPAIVIDIGAHRGNWTRALLSVCPSSQVIMVEASPEKMPYLESFAEEINRSMNQTQIYARNLLLAAEEADDRIFYSSKLAHLFQGTGDSLYRENSNIYDEKNILIRHLPTGTVDSLLSGMNFGDAIQRNVVSVLENGRTRIGKSGYTMIKLDVQGAELEVLQGATSTIAADDVSFILVEVSLDIFQYNEGGARFSEVVAFMASQGFGVFDIHEIHSVRTRPTEKNENTPLRERVLPTFVQIDLLFGRDECRSGGIVHSASSL